MKKQLFFYAGIALLFLAACQKGVERQAPEQAQNFTASEAKEWYYGVFKKTAEWQQSPQKGKKLPDWTSARYKKMGNQEMLEFDLKASTNSYRLFSTGLSFADKIKIANASISRILFIKNSSGKIQVREIQFIPDLDYARKHAFDISANEIGKIQVDFSGLVVSKKWGGTELARNKLKDGKIIMSMTKTLNHSPSLTESCPIGSTEVTEYARDCESHLYGDGLFTYECGEWYPTGNVFCIGNEELGGEPNCTENPNSPECACALTGGCEEPGGGDEPNEFDEEAEAQLIAQIFSAENSNQSENISFTSPVEQSIPFEWVIVKNSSNLWQVKSYDVAKGYNSTNTGALVYDIQHIESKISGQTSWNRIRRRPGGFTPALVNLSWEESSNAKYIAADYKSGRVTVSGILKNFLVNFQLYTQYCDISVH